MRVTLFSLLLSTTLLAVDLPNGRQFRGCDSVDRFEVCDLKWMSVDGEQGFAYAKIRAYLSDTLAGPQVEPGRHKLSILALDQENFYLRGTFNLRSIDANASITESKHVNVKNFNPEYEFTAGYNLEADEEGKVGVWVWNGISHQKIFLSVGKDFNAEKLPVRLIRSLALVATLMGKVQRESDLNLVEGDFVTFKGADGKYHGALLSELGREKSVVLQTLNDGVKKLHASNQVLAKPVRRHGRFHVGQQARLERFSPKNIRIDYLLSDGTAWVTLLSDKTQEVTNVTEIKLFGERR